MLNQSANQPPQGLAEATPRRTVISGLISPMAIHHTLFSACGDCPFPRLFDIAVKVRHNPSLFDAFPASVGAGGTPTKRSGEPRGERQGKHHVSTNKELI